MWRGVIVKRKITALVVLTVLLIVTGCTSREFESNMELGKEQLQVENYLEAYEAFSSAYKDQETAEVKELKELSKLLADGVSQYEKEKYDVALKSFEKAAGYDAKTKEGKKLVTKADGWVTKIDNTQSNLSSKKEGQLGADDPATLEEGNMDTTESRGESDQSQPENNDSNGTNKKNNETEMGKKITIKEAEQLVKDFIQIEDYPQLRVQYDHDNEKGDYIFQVFESVEDGQGGHTATWGWYGVNPKTKDVYDILQ